MMQSMAAMWGIVFGVYAFQYGYFQRKTTVEKVTSGERYVRSFFRIYAAGVETLSAIVVSVLATAAESEILYALAIGLFLGNVSLMFFVIVAEIRTSISDVGWYWGAKMGADLVRERVKQKFLATYEAEAQKALGKSLDDAILEAAGEAVEEIRKSSPGATLNVKGGRPAKPEDRK